MNRSLVTGGNCHGTLTPFPPMRWSPGRFPTCPTCGDPMAPEITAALVDPGRTEFSLSSVEKTLADLVRVGLLANPPRARPRGYRFIGD